MDQARGGIPARDDRGADGPRTDDELERALDALVESEGLSRQEIIRRAVLDRYERAGHTSRVDDSADRMLARWGDVLDRLGAA